LSAKNASASCQVVGDDAGRRVRDEQAVVQHVELDDGREALLPRLQDDIEAVALGNERSWSAFMRTGFPCPPCP
jgi:hypothetical protein